MTELHAFRRPIIVNSLVALICGGTIAAAWWGAGRWFQPKASSARLRVLCEDGWLDSDRLDRFARAEGARLDLYTYRSTPEFLRQMANADGRIDVVCTSSLLLPSLVRSRWIAKTDYEDLATRLKIAADFLHLPYDPGLEYALPAHWTSFGFIGPGTPPTSLKGARGRVGVWASDLNYMALLTLAGVQFEERLESEDQRRLEDDVQRFVNDLGVIPPDPSRADPAQWAKRFDVAHVPATLVDGEPRPGPGEDGGIVDVGLFAVGFRAAHPKLALALISASLAPESATEAADRLRRGLVLSDANATAPPARRPSALRELPLTKLRFPDVNAEAALKFSGVFARARSR